MMLARGKYADYPDIANTMDALRKWHAHLVERKEERRGGGGRKKKKINNEKIIMMIYDDIMGCV